MITQLARLLCGALVLFILVASALLIVILANASGMAQLVFDGYGTSLENSVGLVGMTLAVSVLAVRCWQVGKEVMEKLGRL